MRQPFPSPVDPVDPADVYGDPPRAGPGGRPGVRLNMIASVDGATTVAGVSEGLGGGADHDLFGPASLRLCSVCEQDGFLFLRYRPGPGR